MSNSIVLLNSPWKAAGTEVVGKWWEDDSEYRIQCGHVALAEALVDMQVQFYSAHRRYIEAEKEFIKAKTNCEKLQIFPT